MLNHEEIKKDPQRIAKVGNVPSEKNDWKKFEKNIVRILLNVLYAKKEKIYPAYVSNHEKQVILLIIPNVEEWLCLAVNNCQHYLEE